DRLAAKGIGTARVTLHVGLGTFAPVKVADPTKHVIHREWCEVKPEVVEAIRATKAKGGRVVAVGTTTTRTLESAARPSFPSPLAGEGGSRSEPGEGALSNAGPRSSSVAPSLPLTRLEDSPPSPARGEGKIQPFCGETGLFIHDPFEFRVVDVLVTNFH